MRPLVSRARASLALLALLLCGSTTAPLRAQSPWFASLAMGYGRVDVASDQSELHDQGTFTLAFRVGRAFGDHLRLGFDLGGWLIEPSDYNDPAKGVSVSEAAIVAQYFPVAARPFFVEVGGGLAYYTNHQPDGYGSDGVGWSIGAGWEHRLSERVRVVPSVHWSGGSMRDTRNMLVDRTGLRFGALDARVGGLVLFGRRH